MSARPTHIPPERTRRLASLGSESRAERNAKQVVPWLASIAVHAAIVFAGFLITWTVVQLQPHERPVITADFHALRYEPVTPDPLDPADPSQDPSPLEIDLPPLDRALDDALREFDLDLSSLTDAQPAPAGAEFATPAARGAVSFLGLSTTNARRIVYVIDASGSMIAYLQIILQELARSLEALSPQQSFAIVFFQRENAIQVPPARRLVPATPDAKSAALHWIDQNIIPAGRSNPVEAFEAAMQMGPDVIFLLSDRIRGSGIYEIDQEELLAQLERLNPADRSSGQRRTQINAIQFLDPDPLGTLEKIAELHGGADGRAYKFLSRSELGLSAP